MCHCLGDSDITGVRDSPVRAGVLYTSVYAPPMLWSAVSSQMEPLVPGIKEGSNICDDDGGYVQREHQVTAWVAAGEEGLGEISDLVHRSLPPCTPDRPLWQRQYKRRELRMAGSEVMSLVTLFFCLEPTFRFFFSPPPQFRLCWIWQIALQGFFPPSSAGEVPLLSQ